MQHTKEMLKLRKYFSSKWKYQEVIRNAKKQYLQAGEHLQKLLTMRNEEGKELIKIFESGVIKDLSPEDKRWLNSGANYWPTPIKKKKETSNGHISCNKRNAGSR